MRPSTIEVVAAVPAFSRTGVPRVWLALILAGAAACSASPSPSDREPVGQVRMPLVTSTNDHTYRLNNVYIYISGPLFTQLSGGDPSAAALTATLPTGPYTAYLSSWTLQRDDGTGNFVNVRADLVSRQAVDFTIWNGATSTITYQFSTDGVIVTVGSGQLSVVISVDETAPVCTPFGTDCGDGSWCPPTGLTGTQRACVAAGTGALGQACAGPADCVANTACIDAGTGPVCTALCASGDIGTDCASGGTCQSAGTDYGVCTP